MFSWHLPSKIQWINTFDNRVGIQPYEAQIILYTSFLSQKGPGLHYITKSGQWFLQNLCTFSDDTHGNLLWCTISEHTFPHVAFENCYYYFYVEYLWENYEGIYTVEVWTGA